ncbi:MAG TPA: hypothetical protein VHC21_00475 [Candidatus Saccharimonadales bacterium]|nr:hypothetical protein [Candidatus Saccharimonadales bacterium]
MDSAKQQLADRLKSANNILVTVSRDPSVDQLAALLGLTLLLNKMGKHSVAVFSGQVPPAIEFLKPNETIEKNTDSLRDFIIALDKNKADKLRYKVEDNVVRIFITPYKTSISQEDLEFSQGDFNVDVVVALGVKQQQDLDDAITAHGRILHDATVASVNLAPDGGLGTISWHDPQASSLSELITELVPLVGENLLDNQIATALLTGIVAETDRFSNDKTTSQTMTASSALMAAGANQQLVASKLEEPPAPPAQSPAAKNKAQDGEPPKGDDGTLSIEHDESEPPAEGKTEDKKDEPQSSEPEPQAEKSADQPQPAAELPAPQAPAEEDKPADDHEPPVGEHLTGGTPRLAEPPQLSGTLSANTEPEGLDPVTDPMSLPAEEQPLLSRQPEPPKPTPPLPPAEPVEPPAATSSAAPALPPTPPSPIAPTDQPLPGQSIMPTAADDQPQTLTEIEQSVNSPHIDTARDQVNQALSTGPDTSTPAPIAALNAQPLGEDLHPPAQPPLPTVTPANEPVLPIGPTPAESSDTSPQPAPPSDSLSPSPQVTDPNAPPQVPPPFPVQFGAGNGTTPPNQPGPPL